MFLEVWSWFQLCHFVLCFVWMFLYYSVKLETFGLFNEVKWDYEGFMSNRIILLTCNDKILKFNLLIYYKEIPYNEENNSKINTMWNHFNRFNRNPYNLRTSISTDMALNQTFQRVMMLRWAFWSCPNSRWGQLIFMPRSSLGLKMTWMLGWDPCEPWSSISWSWTFQCSMHQ